MENSKQISIEDGEVLRWDADKQEYVVSKVTVKDLKEQEIIDKYARGDKPMFLDPDNQH